MCVLGVGWAACCCLVPSHPQAQAGRYTATATTQATHHNRVRNFLARVLSGGFCWHCLRALGVCCARVCPLLATCWLLARRPTVGHHGAAMLVLLVWCAYTRQLPLGHGVKPASMRGHSRRRPLQRASRHWARACVPGGLRACGVRPHTPSLGSPAQPRKRGEARWLCVLVALGFGLICIRPPTLPPCPSLCRTLAAGVLLSG